MNTSPGRSAVDAHRRLDRAAPRRDAHHVAVGDAELAASSGERSIVSPRRSGEV